ENGRRCFFRRKPDTDITLGLCFEDKILLAALQRNQFLLAVLGQTQRITVEPARPRPEPHDHVARVLRRNHDRKLRQRQREPGVAEYRAVLDYEGPDTAVVYSHAVTAQGRMCRCIERIDIVPGETECKALNNE